MKIDIYVNNYFMKYNSTQSINDLNNIRLGFVQGIYNTNDLFILRGEPCIYPQFNQLLSVFKEKNYILTTHGYNVQAIIDYPNIIPYISFHWDGFNNDKIKNTNTTNDIIKCLDYLSNKKTQIRIAYTINPFNTEWIDADIQLLKKMLTKYSNMKQPYFLIYQQGEYFQQNNFTWTNLGVAAIDKFNKAGLLTQKNLKFLLTWLIKKNYQCVSPQSETVIMPDATVRLCQSYCMSTIIGDLKKNNLTDILQQSKQQREDAAKCPYKPQCWLSYHFKENIYD